MYVLCINTCFYMGDLLVELTKEARRGPQISEFEASSSFKSSNEGSLTKAGLMPMVWINHAT